MTHSWWWHRSGIRLIARWVCSSSAIQAGKNSRDIGVLLYQAYWCLASGKNKHYLYQVVRISSKQWTSGGSTCYHNISLLYTYYRRKYVFDKVLMHFLNDTHKNIPVVLHILIYIYLLTSPPPYQFYFVHVSTHPALISNNMASNNFLFPHFSLSHKLWWNSCHIIFL